jgi:hypothetical protein
MLDDDSDIEMFVAKVWHDPALKAALIANSAALLKSEGIDVPEGLTVTVVDTPENLPVIEMSYAEPDIGKLIVKAWREPAFKTALIANPVAAAEAEGIDMPGGMKFTVVENTTNHFHLVLPPIPYDGFSDDTLEALAVATPSAGMYPLRRFEIGKMMAKAWRDQAFKEALLANPVAAVKAEGIDVPEGMTLTVVENIDNHFHLVLPPAPTVELSDDGLEAVAASKSFLPFL